MHLLESAVPRLGRASQARREHALEAGRERAARQAGEVRLAAREQPHHVGRAFARERLAVRDELVDDRGDREHVRAAIGPTADEQLRRAIVEPAVDAAGDAGLERLDVPGSEVEQLHLAARREPDVGGLQVEVQHAFAVRVGQALAHLAPDVEDALDRQQRTAAHHLRQAHARHELGRDPGAAVVLPHSENRRDVRVAQGARRLRVALHAPDRPDRVAGGRGVELDRHRAVVIGVPRHVGDAARAAAELAAHLEWTERLRRLQSASRGADSIPLRAGSPRERACYRGGSARRLRRRRLADGDRHRPRPRGDRGASSARSRASASASSES